MGRAAIVGGLLLACNAATPEARPHEVVKAPIASPTPPAPQTKPPAPAGCDRTILEIVVEAPDDRAVFVDSPTLPLPRREVAANTVMRERLDPAPPGVHMIAVRDANGEPQTPDNLPVIVLANEHHRWTAGAEVPRHQIDRCEQGLLAPLQGEDVEPPTMGWGPPMISADGKTVARLATYTKSGSVTSDLALVDATGLRRMPLLSTLTFELEVDPALLQAAGAVLVRDGFTRIVPAQLIPVREVSIQGTTLRVRWRDRTGTAPLPAYPADAVPPGCCAWTSPRAQALPGAQAVLAELSLECATERAGCEDAYTYDAPFSQALAWVPLTQDAGSEPQPR